MKINIKAEFKEVQKGSFNYSNILSDYSVNTQYFTKCDLPYTVISGEIHFLRVPLNRWRESILKMKECGINTISTYVFWNYHEEKKGKCDFSGNKDIAKFLSICRQENMPCILRIGPWCHGEVIRGGFPKRINKMRAKRNNNINYLNEVSDFWTRLYQEVKPYLDAKTVIGIQLENEYTGKTEHIRTLRKLAEEIGFKTPFFTMTAWPSGEADDNFLPMMGGYPDAPWNYGKTELKPNNRFSIWSAKTEDEIGADLHKNKTTDKSAFDNVPYAFCEIGPGNQVTQHRRPYISEKDGYGVGFAKFASGGNWLGYYMFCGGANPNYALMEENKLTGYPNNYPIIDYDFQAPISRYGVCRPHGDRLRLMHLFISNFDNEICKKQSFFPKWNSNNPNDTSFLKCSVRSDENASGYFFSSTYEKGLKYNDFNDVCVSFSLNEKTIKLPSIDIKAGTMFFYPFNIRIGKVNFNYILAQPIAKSESNGKIVCYFLECEGINPKCSVNSEEIPLEFGDSGTDIDDVKIIVIPFDKAKQFHFIDNEPYFLDGTVYKKDENIYCQTYSKENIKNEIELKKCNNTNLAYNHYIYSNGKRCYYELKISKDILKNRDDVALFFNFEGLNLQVFSENTLINDYFNIDKKFVMHLKDYKKYLEKNPTFIIRTAPKTRYGVSHVYNEKDIPLYSNKLELISANEIITTKIK